MFFQSEYHSIQLRNQVSTSVLDILSIGVSVHTIEESASRDKDILKAGYWHAQSVATRIKSSYCSNYLGDWPFPEYVTGVLIDTRNTGDFMSQLEENYTWAFCEHAGTSAYVHRSDLEAIRNGADPTSQRSSCTQRHNLFQRFCREVQYRKEGVSSKTNNTLLAYLSPSILLGALHHHH